MNLWPFNRKPIAQPKQKSWKQLAVDEMKEWRGIGETFLYLGRECVVTGYFHYVPSHLGIDCVVQLSAEYADDLGVIRYCQFNWGEVKAMMAKQPRPAASREAVEEILRKPE